MLQLSDTVFSEKLRAGINYSTGRHRHAFCIPQLSEMNGNQIIRPEIKPIVNGGYGGQPGLAKIRRRLGFRFVLSNPFRVPVAQSSARPDVP